MTELAEEEHPETLTVTYELKQSLRYGENPHQKAAFYKKPLGSDFLYCRSGTTSWKRAYLITISMMQMQPYKL